MAKEEFEKLGFATEEEYQRIRSQAPVKEGTKEGTARTAPPVSAPPFPVPPFPVPPFLSTRSLPRIDRCVISPPTSVPSSAFGRPLSDSQSPSLSPRRSPPPLSPHRPVFSFFTSPCPYVFVTRRRRVRWRDAHPTTRGGLVVQMEEEGLTD